MNRSETQSYQVNYITIIVCPAHRIVYRCSHFEGDNEKRQMLLLEGPNTGIVSAQNSSWKKNNMTQHL